MLREQKIQSIGVIIILGFLISVVYHYFFFTFKGFGYPYNTFLFRPEDRFMDFINNVHYSTNPYSVPNTDAIYLPFLYRLISLFTVINVRTSLAIFLIAFSYSIFLVTKLNIQTNTKNTTIYSIIMAFLSYPFLFSFDRANFEFLVFIFLFLFIYLYEKNSLVSALFLGLAIASKGFPIIMSILLLTNRRYKELIFTGIVALMVTLFSYESYQGGLLPSINGHLNNLFIYNTYYVIELNGIEFGNSLFGAVRFIDFLMPFSYIHDNSVSASFLRGYTIFIILCLGLITLYLFKVKEKYWKKVALLICGLNLFPLVSGDYKLLHILIPLYLFISENEKERLDWVYTLLFGLLLIPKDYYHLPNLQEVSLSIFLSPLIMIVFVLLLMITGLSPIFRSSLKHTSFA